MSAVVPTRQNNFLPTINVTQQMKYLIIFETFVGINRLYLCEYRKCVLWLSYVYSLILLLVIAIILILGDSFTTTQHLYKNVTSIEYLMLGVGALLIQRNQLRKFFSNLQVFDEKLNIGADVTLLSPKHWYLYGVGAVLLFGVLENIFSIIFFFQLTGMSFLIYIIYLPLIAHDVEMVFFCYLLASILSRLRVVKSHVAKVFSVKIEEIEVRPEDEYSNRIEALAKRIDLDVSSVHQLYDILHKCSEKLNNIMSLSMIVMIVSSGLSSIMILKNCISIAQSPENNPYAEEIKSIVIFCVTRCLKYILVLTFPCYISNKTKGEVDTIRTMIYDTLNVVRLDRIERRKLKAFFQLVCEKDFAYTFFGVVNLDMSLPLSYSSLCTTYLIIVVQFSKFFD